jgi:hypothetical protein
MAAGSKLELIIRLACGLTALTLISCQHHNNSGFTGTGSETTNADPKRPDSGGYEYTSITFQRPAESVSITFPPQKSAAAPIEVGLERSSGIISLRLTEALLKIEQRDQVKTFTSFSPHADLSVVINAEGILIFGDDPAFIEWPHDWIVGASGQLGRVTIEEIPSDRIRKSDALYFWVSTSATGCVSTCSSESAAAEETSPGAPICRAAHGNDGRRAGNETISDRAPRCIAVDGSTSGLSASRYDCLCTVKPRLL